MAPLASSEAISVIRSTLRAPRTTLKPSAASRRAAAAPMPLEAPVMTAIPEVLMASRLGTSRHFTVAGRERGPSRNPPGDRYVKSQAILERCRMSASGG